MFIKISKYMLLGVILSFSLLTGNGFAHFDGTNHIHPDRIDITLCPGECFEEDKQVDIEGAPTMGDVIFAFDTTGSMSGILTTAKARALDIMDDIRTLIPDTDFGVMSHRDYPSCCSPICGYPSMGYGSSGDWAYRLDQYLTPDEVAVSTAIAPLSAGGGADGPESYTRVLYESYSDPAVRWRFKAKKIVINFLDNIPHDCDVYSCFGGTPETTGIDPGRDSVVGTADDLPILEVVDNMLKNKITLLTVFSSSGTYFTLWDCLAKRTGGQAFMISSPSDLPTVVRDLIIAELSTITILELGTEPGYESWLVDVAPPFYFSVTLDTPKSKMFHIKICMPLGTPPGIYKFHIFAFGDGAVYGEQEVTIRHCNLIAATNTPTVTPSPTGTWASPTVTPTPVAYLNCSAARDVPCGGGTFAADTATGVSNVSAYSPCRTWNESGKEVVYRVVTDMTGDIVARFKTIAPGVDLDLFILGSCNENDCLASGNNSAEARDLPPGTYYVVVDGYMGDEGSYTLEVVSACLKTSLPVTKGFILLIIPILVVLLILKRIRI